MIYNSETRTMLFYKQYESIDYFLHYPKKKKKRKLWRYTYQPIPNNNLPPHDFLCFLVNYKLFYLSGYLSYNSLLYNLYLISISHFYC